MPILRPCQPTWAVSLPVACYCLLTITICRQVTWLASMRCEVQALVLPVCGAPWWVLLQHSIMLQRLFFNVECGITHFLSAVHVFKVQASSSSLGYFSAKFCFFRGLHCWASPQRKIAYSVTQSLTQLIWCPGNQSACTSEKGRKLIRTICTNCCWHL